MGLTSWEGSRPRKSDVGVAKNYLQAEELEALNRIVTAYLEFAELQAHNRKPMHMQDWIAKLDDFLRLSERDILTHAGKISHEAAIEMAERQYEQFRLKQLAETSPVEIDFLESIRKIEKLKPGRPSQKENKEDPMNRHVNAIAGRLSLRPPQRRSLEILDRITEIVPPEKGLICKRRLRPFRSEFPTVSDFEREFPVPLLCPGHGGRQDPVDGGLYQLSASGPRPEQFLRSGPESDHLQQTDHRLHPQYPQIRLQGDCRVCHRTPGNHYRG